MTQAANMVSKSGANTARNLTIRPATGSRASNACPMPDSDGIKLVIASAVVLKLEILPERGVILGADVDRIGPRRCRIEKHRISLRRLPAELPKERLALLPQDARGLFGPVNRSGGASP